jgi:IQ calmodulin-binding motif
MNSRLCALQALCGDAHSTALQTHVAAAQAQFAAGCKAAQGAMEQQRRLTACERRLWHYQVPPLLLACSSQCDHVMVGQPACTSCALLASRAGLVLALLCIALLTGGLFAHGSSASCAHIAASALLCAVPQALGFVQVGAVPLAPLQQLQAHALRRERAARCIQAAWRQRQDAHRAALRALAARNRAASVLQRRWRALLRRRAANARADAERCTAAQAVSERHARLLAARKVQNAWRHRLRVRKSTWPVACTQLTSVPSCPGQESTPHRMCSPELLANVLRIQAAWRGCLCRKRVASMVWQRELRRRCSLAAPWHKQRKDTLATQGLHQQLLEARQAEQAATLECRAGERVRATRSICQPVQPAVASLCNPGNPQIRCSAPSMQIRYRT